MTLETPLCKSEFEQRNIESEKKKYQGYPLYFARLIEINGTAC